MQSNASETDWSLKADALSKQYVYEDGSKLLALDKVSFTLPSGSCLALIGGNGSGKSTLLKLLASILKPTSGRVTIRGRVASLLDLGAGFHPELTGRENIYFYGRLHSVSDSEIKGCIPQIVHFGGIDAFLDRPLKYYSHGMYLRLAFSTAIHMPFDILLIDEVLAVGDAAFQHKCIEHLGSVVEGRQKTIVIVSHHMNLLSRLCDSALWLSQGRVAGFDAFSRISSEYLQSQLHGTIFQKASVCSLVSCAWDRAHAVYRTGDVARLTIQIHVHNTLESVQIRVNIFDLSEHFITHLDHGFQCDESISLLPGVHRIHIQIPGMDFYPGQYFCRVSIYSEGVLILRQLAAAPFTVENSRWLHMTNARTTVRTGIYLKHSFDFKKEE
ncbi:MAG: polysaccharide ABC transporter ATP-binding protein [Thermaurantimonas sp.]